LEYLVYAFCRWKVAIFEWLRSDLQRGGIMAIWLWYRRGSFALKEQFSCHESAADRAKALRTVVGFVQIIDRSAMSEISAWQINSAIEVDPVTQRLMP
jgi:hypothetical protein